MGLSGIAKAPVSHGVEPHDLETGGLALASALAFRLYRSSLSPPLPRERFSARVESRPILFGVETSALADSGHSLHGPERQVRQKRPFRDRSSIRHSHGKATRRESGLPPSGM